MSGRIFPEVTRIGASIPMFDPYGSDSGDVNVVASTITVSGDSNDIGITMVNDSQIVFASGAVPSSDSYAVNLYSGISTSSSVAPVVNAFGAYNYGSGVYGNLLAGDIILAGKNTASGVPGVFPIISGDSSQNITMRGNGLDLQFSTITNGSAGNSILTFADTVAIRPAGTTGAGALAISNGTASSNANLYQLAVNGDGANGGQLSLTRFQGGSSFPVFNIDNDGNLLMQDPGNIISANNLSTIALQTGSIVVPQQGRSLVTTGSPVPSANLNSGALVANIDFAGSVGQFIAVTTGGVYCLQGFLTVNASVGNRVFTVSAVSTDGVTAGLSYPIYNSANSTPYVTGSGALAGVQIPISVTFKATDNKLAIACSANSLGGGETIDFAMGLTTISRIV